MSSSKQKLEPQDDDASVSQPKPDADGVEENTTNREPTKGRVVTDMVDKFQASAGVATPDNTENTKTSREGSPVRPSRTSSSIPQLTRSRKSSQEFSPTRSSHMGSSHASVPSAAAVQRAMSAQRPQVLAGVDAVIEGSRGDRISKSGHNSPSWPTSPRLRSPPPSIAAARHTATTAKRGEIEQASNISVKRMTSAPPTESIPAVENGESGIQSPQLAGIRTPASRGASAHSALETVEESSMPSTPSIGPLLDSFTDSKVETAPLDETLAKSTQRNQQKGSEIATTVAEGHPKPATDKTENEAKSKVTPAARPATNLAKRSFTSLTGSKNKALEPLRTMTVETETVPSIPQIISGDRGASGRDGGGSVRTKPSSETIRPKKEKKKATRKPASLHAGVGTSKADIFESKVASAVDAASSSDSDETFVYESNPPDMRSNRYHSRTPSVTSQVSQSDQYPGRNKTGGRAGSHGVTGKKSMKFTNNAYNTVDGEHISSDNARGSTRNGSSTPRHHHIGRYSRAGHPSLFDSDSPFTQAGKPSSPRASAGNMTRLSRPNSPRIVGARVPGSPRKGDIFTYDVDEDAADDERAPLVGSVRINRNRHGRRPNSSLQHYEEPPNGCMSRYGACIIITLLILLLCIGSGTFVIALNKPLIDVSIRHIQNVLASEQEIMLDLDVRATNLNLFAISVSELDVSIFAESAYAGTAKSWRKEHSTSFPSWMDRRRQLLSENHLPFRLPYHLHPQNGVDEGTDPIDDPDTGGPKLLLGRVFEFDSPLMFEASPMRRSSSSSVGEIRLTRPGNKTEDDGTARWERVLHHPFELIVRGVIKYQLPLSSRTRSAKIGSRIKVLPEDDAGGGDGDEDGDEDGKPML